MKVIALSMHADKQFIGPMLRVGALGYLLKDCAFGELTRAIRTVLTDRAYLSPRIADVVIQNYVRHGSKDESAAASELTPREREVLQLMAEGHSTKEIARLLKVSGKTIATHRQNIMQKLNLRSVAELVKYAIREGLTSLET